MSAAGTVGVLAALVSERGQQRQVSASAALSAVRDRTVVGREFRELGLPTG